jgi:hypothetical protein
MMSHANNDRPRLSLLIVHLGAVLLATATLEATALFFLRALAAGATVVVIVTVDVAVLVEVDVVVVSTGGAVVVQGGPATVRVVRSKLMLCQRWVQMTSRKLKLSRR